MAIRAGGPSPSGDQAGPGSSGALRASSSSAVEVAVRLDGRGQPLDRLPGPRRALGHRDETQVALGHLEAGVAGQRAEYRRAVERVAQQLRRGRRRRRG